ncbi:MAG TPA: GMC oxidoreductase [Methylophilaceae bacterium]|nr:GMC oxidoreductase [Methylophilaceae bacterium]
MIFSDVAALQKASFSPQVIIIGSGPAGISLALKLEQKNIPSLILEAGGYDFDPDVQAAYQGKVIGDPYFELAGARLRYFGGSSGHWAGMCRPLDEVDFEPRKGMKNSGWPIRKKDLDPYQEETNGILDLEPLDPDEPLSDKLQRVHFQFSPPTRFGQKFRKHIADSKAIGLLLHSPTIDLVPTNGRIHHVVVNARDGQHPINAPYFALCAGGIENSRMLLWANQLHNGGVVPHAQTLGKYWMEHPIFGAGDAVIFNTFAWRSNAHDHITHIAPTRQFLLDTGCGNFGLRLFSGGNLKALVKHGLCIAPEFFTKVAQMMDDNVACATVFRIAWEQIPVEVNRVELDATEKDANGMPHSKLFWHKQPEDRRTVETAIQTFGSYLATQDKGRVRAISWIADGLDYPVNDEKAGFHHMGGTRMAEGPAHGIVDSQCKVFGMDNLYIGGSSVFVTGGFTNPTYSIVQLALRMGDHLEGRIAKA